MRLFLEQVNALIKAKGTLEAVGEVVAWSPPPIHVPNFPRLREQYQLALAWKERAAPALVEGASVEVRTLEMLTYDASKIQIVLPEAKVCALPRFAPPPSPMPPAGCAAECRQECAQTLGRLEKRLNF